MGVLALTVVTSVVNGFEVGLAKGITALNGDVLLYSRGNPIRDPSAIIEKIKRVLPEATGVNASFVTQIMLSGVNGTAGAVLEGVDFASKDTTASISPLVTDGRVPKEDGEVVLGSALAEKIRVTVGDPVRLIAPFVNRKDGGRSTPKVLEAKVVGIIDFGMHKYDSKLIFSTLASVQDFLGHPARVTNFKIQLEKGTSPRKAADALSENFGFPFKAKDWWQLNGTVFYAIQLEKMVISIILAVIVVVAAFNVVSTLMMMIHDKTREIAIMKSMGMKKKHAFSLFVLIGTGLGGLGVVIGGLLGLGVNLVLGSIDVLELPKDVYAVSRLTIEMNPLEIGGIVLMALAICFVATLYPAWSVARRTPLEGVRNES